MTYINQLTEAMLCCVEHIRVFGCQAKSQLTRGTGVPCVPQKTMSS